MKPDFLSSEQYKKKPGKAKGQAIALVVSDTQELRGEALLLDKQCNGLISRAITQGKFSGKAGQVTHLVAPVELPYVQIIVIGLGDAKKVTPRDWEKAGALMLSKANALNISQLHILLDVLPARVKRSDVEARLAYGAVLESYRFDKYRTKEKKEDKPGLKKLSVITANAKDASKGYGQLEALKDGIFLTRDLVWEPANILHPESFAKICKGLEKDGIAVKVLGEKEMTKLGMGALLGVGQGSVRESKMVVMQWNGGKKKDKPVAFVGKGVCFDTGGISLKPSKGMEDMKWDMGGAGTVVGLMKALAGRKAKANVVGVVGLVENMPDGNAQRPGDVVTSMSGQTIEVLNTDAEGRLVLADALWYTQEKFRPQFIVDLATLTGAIVISLGHEYAGLFSNDDKLSRQLEKLGEETGDKVWRFPMSDAYDKQIDSDIADMQNIGQRGAGSITAAQFLQRFVNETPWAHLDIAGMAWSDKATPTIPKGGTGFGVRLLDALIANHYEG